MTYNVILTYNKYPEYTTKGAYDIEAPNAHDAKKEARKRYAEYYGFEIEHIHPYIINEQMIEYKRLNQLP